MAEPAYIRPVGVISSTVHQDIEDLFLTALGYECTAQLEVPYKWSVFVKQDAGISPNAVRASVHHYLRDTEDGQQRLRQRYGFLGDLSDADAPRRKVATSP